MKIGLVSQPNYEVQKNAKGGARFFTYQYLKALDQKNDIYVTAFLSKKSDINLKNVKIVKKFDLVLPSPQNKSFDEKVKTRLIRYIYFYKNILLNYQDKVDLFHFFIGGYAFFETWMPLVTSLASLTKKPIIITFHTSSPFYDLHIEKVMQRIIPKNVFCTSVSRFQQNIMPLKFYRNIYNGVDLNVFSYNNKPANSLLWIGRITEKKELHIAAHFAKRAGIRLNIAGRVNFDKKNNEDTKYFISKIKPLLSKKIKYVGFLGLKEKVKYYKKSKAMLFTSSMAEGCPLVILESCACGTPVIAFRNLSARELIKNGVNGFFTRTEREFIKAIKDIDKIDRRKCREYIEKNFSFNNTLDQYINLYKEILRKD